MDWTELDRRLAELEARLRSDPAALARERTRLLKETALAAHRESAGKVKTVPSVPVPSPSWLGVWYTPGVSAVSLAIRDDPEASFELTGRGNRVAIVTDSTRVLGDGDCGPAGGMGVMEGKALLMSLLAGIDAWPVCADTRRSDGTGDPEKLVAFVRALVPSVGAVNLEDISQPSCYGVLEELRDSCGIPVWHDDAQGTACVVLAALENALAITGRRLPDTRFVLLGAGAANSTTARLLFAAGADPALVAVFDEHGQLSPGRTDFEGPGWGWHRKLCAMSGRRFDSPREALAGCDVLVAASRPGPGVVPAGWIRGMAPDPVVIACANPVPEIYPAEALSAGAAVVATGRGDFPNQVNNALAFPGILRGALDCRAIAISDGMAIAASSAIAALARESGLSAERIVPSLDNPGLVKAVAGAVMSRAASEGLARKPLPPG
ncbi:MAG TPA: malic enzyme-like NAD(P)-binding protein [Candidatus Fermentibacter sp.]|nr:malic enzyme-like NAD(P)-binding protein [Candidatus Fermentibacter sp.]